MVCERKHYDYSFSKIHHLWLVFDVRFTPHKTPREQGCQLVWCYVMILISPDIRNTWQQT